MIKFNAETYNYDRINDETGVTVEHDVPYIRFIVKQCKTKEGKAFKAYKAVTNNGKYLDASFPYDMGFDSGKATAFILINPVYNIDRNRLYPRMYIKKFEAIEEFIPIKDRFLDI